MANKLNLIEATLGLALVLAPAASARQSRPPARGPSVQVVRVSAPDAFDWGDAGIGAAGGLGVAMIAVGGGLAIVKRDGSGRRQSR